MLNTNLFQQILDRMGVIMMENGLITIDVPEKAARKMTRHEYYLIRSWLRRVKREMIKDRLERAEDENTA